MFALSVKHSCFKATGQIWVLISIMNQGVLFIFTLWLDIQDKANIWNCPCSSRRIMVGKGKFTIMAMVDPHKNQFLMGGFLWASCSWNESLTSVLKNKRHSRSHPAFTESALSSYHSAWSGSASMHVSHGFLGIWGMERIRRAMPQRKRRTKPTQAQAKDQA